jgi:CHAT domain-containing protein
MRKLLFFCCCMLAIWIPDTEGRAARSAQPGALGRVQPSEEVPEGKMPGVKEEGAKIKELLKAGKYEDAQSLAKELLAKCERSLGPEHPGTAGALMWLAFAHDSRYQYNAAFPLYQRALQIREKTLGPEHPATAASLARLARCYRLLGDSAKSLPLAQRALQIREKTLGPEHPDTAASLNLLGVTYAMGDPQKGLPFVLKALAIREKVLGPEHPQTADSMEALGKLYALMGDPAKGLPLVRRAAEVNEKVLGLDSTATAASLKKLGSLYLATKDYVLAEATFRKARYKQGEQGLIQIFLITGRYQDALSMLNKIGVEAYYRPQYQAQYYTQKGMALAGLGHQKEAVAAFLEAIGSIEDLRAKTAGERTAFFEFGMVGSYFQAYRGLVMLLAGMAQKGDPLPSSLTAFGKTSGEAAFYFAEAAKARSLLEAMSGSAGRALIPGPPADLAAQEKRLLEKRASLEAQWEEVIVPHRGRGRDAEAFQIKKDALKKEEQKFVSELRQRVPRYAALAYPQPYKAQELPLKAGEVLLEYALGEKESYIFRVEPGGKTQVFRLALGQEALERRLGPMLAPFRQSALRREDLSRFVMADATALYQEILAPALSGVNHGTRLIIVPDGPLGAFPFEALVVKAGPDWGKCTLVGDSWPVTYSQSAAILALNRHLELSRASKPLFALGDCIYAKDSSRYHAYKAGKEKAGELKHAGPEKAMTMAATDRGWGRLEFPPLPETRQTVLELAALFQEKPQPPQILLDVFATETGVRQAKLSQYRYLFFGTHGFLADKLTGVQEPTLVLTQVENKPPDDGFLSFSKVLQLKLDADLVTLAACMTGVGQVMQGEGVLNFARAFQQAGARSVMVSLWNIPVDESLKFYSTFYKALREGKTKLQALQSARQAVKGKEPHPYFWSGLILHGEG